MNKVLNGLDIEKVLFFDIEVARKSHKLEVDSKEFELFQHKSRDRDTDEYLEAKEVQELYERQAGLRLCYNKIICISVGFVNKGKVRIKAITGDEGDIISQFCDIANRFENLCGVNVLEYDLGLISVNASKYFNLTDKLVDRFIVSGKKPWDIKSVFDLLSIFKSGFRVNPSMAEMCYHFGIEDSKGDISGADVSRVYYDEGVERIATYCNLDVFASIQLFCAMRYQPLFESFEAVDDKQLPKDERTLLQRIYEDRCIGEASKEEIKALCAKKKLTKKDKENLEVILYNTLIRSDFINNDQDNKATKEDKLNQVKELINEL